ncbi:MAG TPA: serine/threonine-protein kinase, partial [Tepidisphaeraceae bacterium]
MKSTFQQVRSIFMSAVELPAEEWEAYLAEACGADAALRKQVQILLEAHRGGTGLLDDVTRDGEVTLAKPSADKAGTVIAGRYKLLETIGEGGMGSVWLAQQSSPVKRKVALKLIKRGMDSRQVLNRFEAERQALAMMDHPNIAKVLDGGLTEEGRPFFVMELVRGTPITEYSDACKLTLRERLELFVPVCQAIQHAHQKGIIHRDIKPSNVLIALYDDKPVPKVIDFGVAKATGQSLSDETLNTGFGGVIGTPQYMSPEQATLNNLDIDTRSDVYSLGVVLYELLTGSPPFTRQELEKKG